MSLWGNLDAANNAPKFAGTGGIGLTANTQQLFSNTTFATTSTSLGRAGQAIGVFGLSAVEASNTGAGKANTASAHAGWVMRKEGTGGRAGRIQTETLVAMGSMTGDHAAANTTYPGI
jgi:hypothetical protein